MDLHQPLESQHSYRYRIFTKNKQATGAHLAGGGGGPGGPDPCPFSIQSRLCPQILKPIWKKRFENQFKKRKNPSKRYTNSILLKFFNAALTSAGQKNAELTFEKIHLIRKFKVRIFNSMAFIFYLSFHMLSYFRVIRNL